MYLIGVAGGSGSGKTTFAEKLINLTNDDEIQIINLDSYYLPKLPPECLTESGKDNFDHPDAFDWDLLKQQLKDLKDGKSIEMPIYDFKSSTRLQETKMINPSKVIVFEGIFGLFHKDVRDLLEIQIFLKVQADIRFTRRLRRDIQERGRSLDSVISQYYETVRPMHQKFLGSQIQFADLIVGEETDIAANIVTAKIKELLRSNINEAFLKREDHLKQELNITNGYI